MNTAAGSLKHDQYTSHGPDTLTVNSQISVEDQAVFIQTSYGLKRHEQVGETQLEKHSKVLNWLASCRHNIVVLHFQLTNTFPRCDTDNLMDWQSPTESVVDYLDTSGTPISVVQVPAQLQNVNVGQSGSQPQGASMGPENAQSQNTHTGDRNTQPEDEGERMLWARFQEEYSRDMIILAPFQGTPTGDRNAQPEDEGEQMLWARFQEEYCRDMIILAQLQGTSAGDRNAQPEAVMEWQVFLVQTYHLEASYGVY